MDEIEIQALIDEYNRCEAEQQGRLVELYQLLRDERKGMRKVTFSGDQWSNVWDPETWPDRIAIPRLIQPMVRLITEIIPGDPV